MPFSSPGQFAPIAIVQTAVNSTPSGTFAPEAVSFAATQVGSFLIAFAHSNSNGTFGLPAGWVAVYNSQYVDATLCAVYPNNPGGITSLSVTCANNNIKSLTVFEVSGVASSGYAGLNNQSNNQAGTQTASSLSAGTTTTPDICFGFHMLDGGTVSGITGGTGESVDASAAPPSGFLIEHNIQSVPGAYSTAASWTNGSIWSVLGVSFKPGSPGAVGSFPAATT